MPWQRSIMLTQILKKEIYIYNYTKKNCLRLLHNTVVAFGVPSDWGEENRHDEMKRFVKSCLKVSCKISDATSMHFYLVLRSIPHAKLEQHSLPNYQYPNI